MTVSKAFEVSENKPNNFSPDPENIITDSKQYNTMSVIMRTLISPQSISTQQFIQAITTEQLELSTLIKFKSAIVDAITLRIKRDYEDLKRDLSLKSIFDTYNDLVDMIIKLDCNANQFTPQRIALDQLVQIKEKLPEITAKSIRTGDGRRKIIIKNNFDQFFKKTIEKLEEQLQQSLDKKNHKKALTVTHYLILTTREDDQRKYEKYKLFINV